MISCPACGGRERTPRSKADQSWPFPVSTCHYCRMVYQHGAPGSKVLASMYKDIYHEEMYQHTLEQDLDTADKRLDHYRFDPATRVLDVGAGNGAFITRAMERGIDVWGVEPSKNTDHPRIYAGFLYDVNFPTQSFDVLTLHDVVEHCPDITGLLTECRRVLKDGGILYLEIPDVWTSEGHKHRKHEHLWYPMKEEAIHFVEHLGYKLHKQYHPILGKMLLSFTVKHAKPVSILVPPGIGDAYWSLVKLPGFLKEQGIENPHVYISSPKAAKDRCFDFVQRLPLVYAAGYKKHSNKSKEFQEVYMADARTVLPKVAGCDFFVAYNGVTRFGKSIDLVDPQYTPDWFPRMFVSKAEAAYGASLVEKYGPYLVGYYVNHGMYRHWLAEFSVERIHESNQLLCDRLGCHMVLIGASWDAEGVNEQLKKLDTKGIYIDLTGKTTLEHCFGLMRASSGVVGFPSGITILATMFKVPTLMFWNQYFHKGFWHNAVAPQALLNWYNYVDTLDACPAQVMNRFLALRDGVGQDVRSGVRWNLQARCPETKRLRHARKKKQPKMDPAKTVVATVLRSGGDFGEEHALCLHKQVRRLMGKAVTIKCFVDEDIPAESVAADEIVPLVHKEWCGWWSKVEIFRGDAGLCDPNVRAIYLDLDTVLLDTVDELRTTPVKFAMLHGFKRPERRASGVMVWQGDYSKVYKRLALRKTPPTLKEWDQVHIASAVRADYHDVELVQDVVRVKSFKNDCNNHRPRNVQIVCFHGKPRPWDCEEEWVRKELAQYA